MENAYCMRMSQIIQTRPQQELDILFNLYNRLSVEAKNIIASIIALASTGREKPLFETIPYLSEENNIALQFNILGGWTRGKENIQTTIVPYADSEEKRALDGMQDFYKAQVKAVRGYYDATKNLSVQIDRIEMFAMSKLMELDDDYLKQLSKTNELQSFSYLEHLAQVLLEKIDLHLD